LSQSLKVFNANDLGNEGMLKSAITPKKLYVKVGARVMLTVNINIPLGLVNGSMGKVIDISGAGIKVLFDNGLESWLNPQTVASVKLRGNVVAERVQYPLRLAWAISIHKSQGMTIEKLRVNMEGIFEAGQAYVALSRAKSIEGLEVKNFSAGHVRANEQAVKFYQEA
jgi:ATP-dependent DNA helicase PIF1